MNSKGRKLSNTKRSIQQASDVVMSPVGEGEASSSSDVIMESQESQTNKRQRNYSDILMASPEPEKASTSDRNTPSPTEEAVDRFVSTFAAEGMVVNGMPGFKFYSSNSLGDGAFGEVKLIQNAATDECYACKVISPCHVKRYYKDIKREIMIQKSLKHDRIVKIFKSIFSATGVYIVMDYISGGELFDRIEPDAGMNEAEAMRFFRQMLEGIGYLHSNFICHRDIKPENLLLDQHDNIKICDFGFAVKFVDSEGRICKVSKMCGTKPYTPPEVHTRKEYEGPPVDIWSSGIVLIAMLTGELVWDSTEPSSEEYQTFHNNECLNSDPWTKFDQTHLALFKGMLRHDPRKRYTIKQILDSKWMNRPPREGKLSSSSRNNVEARHLYYGHSENAMNPAEFQRFTTPFEGNHSQPANFFRGKDDSSEVADPHIQSYSQPAQEAEGMLLTQPDDSQSQLDYPAGKKRMIQLVKRMTRFYVNPSIGCERVWKSLAEVCVGLGFEVREHVKNVLTISGVDKRRHGLKFKATLVKRINCEKEFIDFRRSMGDGIEFKRNFERIRSSLGDGAMKMPVMAYDGI